MLSVTACVILYLEVEVRAGERFQREVLLGRALHSWLMLLQNLGASSGGHSRSNYIYSLSSFGIHDFY